MSEYYHEYDETSSYVVTVKPTSLPYLQEQLDATTVERGAYKVLQDVIAYPKLPAYKNREVADAHRLLFNLAGSQYGVGCGTEHPRDQSILYFYHDVNYSPADGIPSPEVRIGLIINDQNNALAVLGTPPENRIRNPFGYEVSEYKNQQADIKEEQQGNSQIRSIV